MASPAADFWISPAPYEVASVEPAITETLLAIAPAPPAISPTDRLISAVVADCSSTAAATRVWFSLIRMITAVISSIAPVAWLVSPWIASILLLMSSVARPVSCASSLTSVATTAKPLPASPARAASIVAFSASRLVCSAIEVIAWTISPISTLASFNRKTYPEVVSAEQAAAAATAAAAAVWVAISRIEAPISSVAADIAATLFETSIADWETTPAWAAVSSAA